jgi:hypothetical protein
VRKYDGLVFLMAEGKMFPVTAELVQAENTLVLPVHLIRTTNEKHMEETCLSFSVRGKL